MHGLYSRSYLDSLYSGPDPSQYLVRLERYCIEIKDYTSLARKYDILCLFEDPEFRTLEEMACPAAETSPPIFDSHTISDIMHQVSRAVMTLHCFGYGLVHRNIHPRHVVLVGNAPNRYKLSGLLGVCWNTNAFKTQLPHCDVQTLIKDLSCYTEGDWRAPELEPCNASRRIDVNAGECCKRQ